MEITVMDHFSAQEEPKTYSGTPMEVEAQLRDHFKGVLGHIPFGDLYEMVRCLRAMTGIDIHVSEEPTKRHIKRRRGFPALSDPWLHDADLPLDNSDDNL